MAELCGEAGEITLRLLDKSILLALGGLFVQEMIHRIIESQNSLG